MSDITAKTTQRIREQSMTAQMKIAAHVAEGGSLDDAQVRGAIIDGMFDVAGLVVLLSGEDHRALVREGIRSAVEDLPAPGDA